MLRHTGVKLDLLSDPAMFAMFDSGIRGGVAMISKRYAKANNPQMGDDFDESSAQSTIKGLDANNLYGHAMSQFLPDGEFSWVPLEELEAINWIEEKDEQEWGYTLKVDLKYPKKLHDLHNDFPLAQSASTYKPNC